MKKVLCINHNIEGFKNKIAQKPVYGMFSKTCDPSFVEAVGYAGYDYIILDIEHGPNSLEALQNLIRAAQVSNIFPIVRVKENDNNCIGEVLDIGAAGIQVPQVMSSNDVLRIMKHAKFTPKGSRGICRFVRAANYSATNRFEYFDKANSTLVIAQLEGKDALINLQSILDVAGIDIVFIGPYDLSQSMGCPGEVDHPVVEEKMLEITNECIKRNIHVGTFVDSIDAAHKWERVGIRYIAYSVDIGIFYDACKSTLNLLNK